MKLITKRSAIVLQIENFEPFPGLHEVSSLFAFLQPVTVSFLGLANMPYESLGGFNTILSMRWEIVVIGNSPECVHK